MAKSQKGKGTKDQQIANLKAEMTDEEIAQAEKMAQDERQWCVAAVAFKSRTRPNSQPTGLTKSQRIFYFQMKKIASQKAEEWRNSRLSEKGIDPKNFGSEVDPTDEEQAKITGTTA